MGSDGTETFERRPQNWIERPTFRTLLARGKRAVQRSSTFAAVTSFGARVSGWACRRLVTCVTDKFWPKPVLFLSTCTSWRSRAEQEQSGPAKLPAGCESQDSGPKSFGFAAIRKSFRRLAAIGRLARGRREVQVQASQSEAVLS